MLSLPAHLFNVVGTRLLVIGRKQHLMLWIAVATAVLNAVLDALFYLLLGPIGIIVSTVVLRWTMAGVYLVLLRTVVPATIGARSSAERDSPSRDPAPGSDHLPGNVPNRSGYKGRIRLGSTSGRKVGPGPTASAGRVAKNVRLDFFGPLSALPFRSGTGADA